jgi:hypothetical protein
VVVEKVMQDQVVQINHQQELPILAAAVEQIILDVAVEKQVVQV